jgi:hypothetical protein
MEKRGTPMAERGASGQTSFTMRGNTRPMKPATASRLKNRHRFSSIEATPKKKPRRGGAASKIKKD